LCPASASDLSWPLQLGAAMAMTLPVAIVFFVFQNYLMRGAGGGVEE
jgi:ABC-type glycerol-3-phosphate transport system permease component